MSYRIAYQGPFLTGAIHSDVTVGTSAVQLLAAATVPERRIWVIVQNQNGTATVDIILNASGTAGIALAPGTFIQLDNYNGPVRAISTAAGTTVHVAYATA
jgi:hypothetical protein